MISTPAHNARGAANRVANYAAQKAKDDCPLDKKSAHPWKPVLARHVRCYLNEVGEPMIVLGNGTPMPATVGEWTLWVMYQEAINGR